MINASGYSATCKSDPNVEKTFDAINLTDVVPVDYEGNAEKHRLLLVPPNPKLFVKTFSTRVSCATFGT